MDRREKEFVTGENQGKLNGVDTLRSGSEYYRWREVNLERLGSWNRDMEMNKYGEHLGVRESLATRKWGCQPWGWGNRWRGEERSVMDIHIGNRLFRTLDTWSGSLDLK